MPGPLQEEPGNREDFRVSHLAKQASACNSNLFVSRLPHTGLTQPNFAEADLLLASLFDAGLHAERVAMKLDCVATALRRQLISYDSAIYWLFDLGLLNYVLRPEFSYEAVQ
jgi:hypothetical protein